ncbi:hypothetical protein GJ744_005134 [Endocarpon pusillum]|uniref:Uncharacterized protein n=1 Tax=Endocarpon pusillum TaxID=364733 RepID=A0A8H7AQR2_9EURO|nr:hypothetical protein GJ744_005134 [Endocarpon pusillum]
MRVKHVFLLRLLNRWRSRDRRGSSVSSGFKQCASLPTSVPSLRDKRQSDPRWREKIKDLREEHRISQETAFLLSKYSVHQLWMELQTLPTNESAQVEE